MDNVPDMKAKAAQSAANKGKEEPRIVGGKTGDEEKLTSD